MATVALPSKADDSSPSFDFEDRPVRVMAMLGLGSLVGFSGVTVGYNPSDRFEGGAGLGFNGHGPSGGPYLRFRPRTWSNPVSRTRHGLALDLGLSAGKLHLASDLIHRLSGAAAPRYRSDLALWLQAELSWEMVTVEGFSLRAGHGASVLLGAVDVDCQEAPGAADRDRVPCGEPARWVPVALFGVGYAL